MSLKLSNSPGFIFLKEGPIINRPALYLIIIFLFFVSNRDDELCGQDFDLITDSVQMYWPAAELAKPGYLETVIDPDFGTKITRIVGDPGTSIPVVGNTWQPVARHGYSKKPVWNADESLIFLEKHRGGMNPLFLDGETYEVLFYGGESATENRWHPTNPDLMVLITDHAIKSWNVRDKSVTELFSHSEYNDFHIGPWEGNLSADGKWLVINANRITDTVRVGPLWSEYGRPSHYDLTVDENGDEVAVGVSKSSPDDGHVIKRRLTDAEVTVLTHGGYGTHTSTRCLGRPGWAITSFNHKGPRNWEPYYNEIANDRANIYPNPASDYIIIPDQYMNFAYRIVTLNGQLIDEGRVGTEPLNITSFHTGLYIVELLNFSENKRFSLSVVKNR